MSLVTCRWQQICYDDSSEWPVRVSNMIVCLMRTGRCQNDGSGSHRSAQFTDPICEASCPAAGRVPIATGKYDDCAESRVRRIEVDSSQAVGSPERVPHRPDRPADRTDQGVDNRQPQNTRDSNLSSDKCTKPQ